MKHLRILLLATVATGGVFAAFASGAGPLARLSNSAAGVTGANAPLVLVDDDEDEDEDEDEGGYFHWRKSGHGHDRHDGEHHGDDDDDDGEDDDDGQRQGGRNNPGQVGTTMPPKNGLILEGSAPKVQVH